MIPVFTSRLGTDRRTNIASSPQTPTLRPAGLSVTLLLWLIPQLQAPALLHLKLKSLQQHKEQLQMKGQLQQLQMKDLGHPQVVKGHQQKGQLLHLSLQQHKEQLQKKGQGHLQLLKGQLKPLQGPLHSQQRVHPLQKRSRRCQEMLTRSWRRSSSSHPPPLPLLRPPWQHPAPTQRVQGYPQSFKLSPIFRLKI